MKTKVNLAHDLLISEYITNKCKASMIYAQNLYSSFCNNLFLKNDEEWSCSWRYAGGIVAEIRDVGEDYIDFYCSGIGSGHEGYVGESCVTDEIRDDLLQLGWTIKSYDPSVSCDTLEVIEPRVWKYRIVRDIKSRVHMDDSITYGIYEVCYDKNGNITNIDKDYPCILEDSLNDLKITLQKLVESFDSPIIDSDTRKDV